ncbi:YciK family oxidoreductase [soil metagenome]
MTTVATQEVIRSVVAPANRLTGKVALITGGTRGIGFAIAKAYVLEGAKVVIASRTASELKLAMSTLKEMGGEATATRIDLTSQSGCESLYTAAIRSYGKIDILVNNAAILGPRAAILNYPAADWANVMRTNVDVVYWMCKAALGSMIPANEGCIINVTSGIANRGRAGWGAYSVSKAAVNNFTQILAEEVAGYKIRVNGVNPGATRTMMRAEAFPKEDAADLPGPDDVVNPFIYLASEASRGVTGMVLEASDWMGRSF